MNHFALTPPARRPHAPIGSNRTALLSGIACVLPLLTCAGIAFAQEADTALEEVTVTATLLTASTAPLSATVLTEHTQPRRGAAHLEDVITLAPNLTASSGASRSRFFRFGASVSAVSLSSRSIPQWASCWMASISAAPAAR